MQGIFRRGFILILSVTALLCLSIANAKNAPCLSPPSKKAVLNAAKKAFPAVVHLEIASKEKPGTHPLSFYFTLLPHSHRASMNDLLSARSGTGILIDSDGHILTNAFLIRGGQEIRCLLFKGKWFEAKTVGYDLGTDIAVLKINGNGPFPHIASGNSEKITAGTWVVALGRFSAQKPSITQGIISAEYRKTTFTLESYQDFLQTDAQIDLKNSGGPLINLSGQVIGINDALLTRIGGFQGIGFAIPWGLAQHIANQIIKTGTVEHGWLGLRVQDVVLRSKRDKKGFIRGILVIDAVQGGPAQKAGIRPGDIILSYQETPVSDTAHLKRLVSMTSIGKTVKIKILRQGREMELPITIGARQMPTPGGGLKTILGIAVSPLPKPSSRGETGVAISWIDPYGPMSRAGFETKDILLEANGRPIRSENDLELILNQLKPGEPITFHAVDHRTHREGYVQVLTTR